MQLLLAVRQVLYSAAHSLTSCPLSQDDAAIDDPALVHHMASPVSFSERVRRLLASSARP